MDASMAKLFAAEAASDVTRRAVQLFGGYGYTREYPVERMTCFKNLINKEIDKYMNFLEVKNIESSLTGTVYYHLPGLFEFYDFYRVFLPLFYEHREYFYDWCDIGSIYGAPSDCIWGGGRVSDGDSNPEEVLTLLEEYGISSRLTFSNSLLKKEHLSDRKCNELCRLFEKNNKVQNGVIVHSELLLDYLKNNYPELYPYHLQQR